MKGKAEGHVGNAENESQHGFWVYEDGYSHWGLNMFRTSKAGWMGGLPITQDNHNKLDEVGKAKFYADEAQKIKDAQDAAELAAKKHEVARKK